MVDKNPVLVALLLLLSLGISTAQAQQQQEQEPYFGLFRWGVMVNALHNPYATDNMHSGVDLEIHVPKVPLFFGLGLRIIIPVTPTAAGSGRVRCGTGQTWEAAACSLV